MTYRVVRTLSRKGKLYYPGSLTQLEWLDQEKIDKLIAVGAVRAQGSPPLAELAGWKTRAKRLEPAGITTIEQFLEATDETILEATGVTKRSTVTKWRDQLVVWSEAVPPKKSG